MPANVRVRYAPSPTGAPHIGNIRTALFNWLYARHTGGVFILRVEDTDAERKVPGALEAILEGLRWLGLNWDEGPEVGGGCGPYVQSQRLDIYRGHALRLLEAGHAYICTCPPERLEQVRKAQAARGEPPGYDRHCRERGLTDWDALRRDPSAKPVVRFKTPLQGQARFHDLLRGELVFDNARLDDFVLLKSDGFPTYHLANVLDDYLMRITHVMRAEEWLPSTPRHVLLYQALGFQPPIFAHLSIILGPDRSKLSKRHGATSILEYREQGYLPEAMVNFMALLGWSLDDKTEIIDLQDLVRHFGLERIVKSPAIFNIEKLNWMNGVYMRRLSIRELTARALPYLENDLPPGVPRPLDMGYVSRVMPLVQERARTLKEIPELASFFFLPVPDYKDDALIQKGMDREATAGALEVAQARLRPLGAFDAASLEGILRPLAEELVLKPGQLFGVLRVATTGRTAAPPLFQTMEVLGKERCLERIQDALHKLRS